AVELNSAYAMRFSVGLAVDQCPADVYLWADSDRLMQVATNVITNATKLSPQGETVRVCAEATDYDVRILVKDRGPGVPPEFRSRIFQRFAQAESLDRRQRTGSGLGLSISKALMER